jgi:hypothetical protein
MFWALQHPGEPCPQGSHGTPALGPNEDTGVCVTCGFPVPVMRPVGETYGLHLDDCSLPERHRGRCVGGGEGHPPAALVRGYWPGMEDDIQAAGTLRLISTLRGLRLARGPFSHFRNQEPAWPSCTTPQPQPRRLPKMRH